MDISDTKKNYKRLLNYKPIEFAIEKVLLHFEILSDHVFVYNKIHISNLNPKNNTTLVLDGDDLVLQSVKLNGKRLSQNEFIEDTNSLTIYNVNDKSIIELETILEPKNNLKLFGLYESNNILCTQCEPEGFRRISYFLDRPDILTIYTVSIRAKKQDYPVLLSNGDLVNKHEDDVYHTVTWKDPFPKPSYLFALVAGDLAHKDTIYITESGRRISLNIYAKKEHIGQCEYALQVLSKSMRWDEEKYKLECDISTYSIVAVSHFNQGAMENKGLNIFNTSCILANNKTTTDSGFLRVATVVAHEYFHNWTGNRVTCRDWFQLSLKEGLTVFREQQFAEDTMSEHLPRLSYISVLENNQFLEDKSQLAHAVRPLEYLEVNNFYTNTIYNKGAEIIRTLYNIIGEKSFYNGISTYLSNFDGKAATIEDLISSMEQNTSIDISSFINWYNKIGTPIVNVETEYQPEKKKLLISFQQNKTTSDLNKVDTPLMIPMFINIIDFTNPKSQKEHRLILNKEKEVFEFLNIENKSVVTFLRKFSAPIIVDIDRSLEELVFIVENDADEYTKIKSMSSIYMKVINSIYQGEQEDKQVSHNITIYIDLFKKILSSSLHNTIKGYLLKAPTLQYLLQIMTDVRLDRLIRSVDILNNEIIKHCLIELTYEIQQLNNNLEDSTISSRMFKEVVLNYIMMSKTEQSYQICENIYSSNNITDKVMAFSNMCKYDIDNFEHYVSDFYNSYYKDEILIDKWFEAQAGSFKRNSIARIKYLLTHPKFNINSPNNVRSLLKTYFHNIPVFHRDGKLSLYFFKNMIIETDTVNPMISSSLIQCISYWNNLHEVDREKIYSVIKEINQNCISNNLKEVIDSYLQ